MRLTLSFSAFPDLGTSIVLMIFAIISMVSCHSFIKHTDVKGTYVYNNPSGEETIYSCLRLKDDSTFSYYGINKSKLVSENNHHYWMTGGKWNISSDNVITLNSFTIDLMKSFKLERSDWERLNKILSLDEEQIIAIKKYKMTFDQSDSSILDIKNQIKLMLE